MTRIGLLAVLLATSIARADPPRAGPGSSRLDQPIQQIVIGSSIFDFFYTPAATAAAYQLASDPSDRLPGSWAWAIPVAGPLVTGVLHVRNARAGSPASRRGSGWR